MRLHQPCTIDILVCTARDPIMILWKGGITFEISGVHSPRARYVRLTYHPHYPKAIIDLATKIIPFLSRQAQTYGHSARSLRNHALTPKSHLRFHQYKPQCLHFLHPYFVFLFKSRNVWPLIFAPHRFCLVRIRHRPVQVESFVGVCFSACDVLVQSGISCSIISLS